MHAACSTVKIIRSSRLIMYSILALLIVVLTVGLDAMRYCYSNASKN